MQESDFFLSFGKMLGEEKKGGEIVVSWTLWCFIFCVNSAAVISSDTLQISAAIFDMISKICCCNGAATHTGFLVYYVAVICWFSMLEIVLFVSLLSFYLRRQIGGE